MHKNLSEPANPSAGSPASSSLEGILSGSLPRGVSAAPAVRSPCRCLLAEAGQEAMAASIREYLELLPPDSRADPKVYKSRLGICRACPSLRDGTCVRCGCYVEARAGKKLLSCPAVPPLW